MTTPARPLGLRDVLRGMVVGGRTLAESPDGKNGYWTYCRAHAQSVFWDGHCDCTCRTKDDWHNRPPGSVFHDESSPQHPHNTDCVRIGPFMSEREARRLTAAFAPWDDGPIPLSMEIEL